MNHPRSDETRSDPALPDVAPLTSADQLAREASPEVLSDEERARLAVEAARIEDA
jgi:hypothetical protein